MGFPEFKIISWILISIPFTKKMSRDSDGNITTSKKIRSIWDLRFLILLDFYLGYPSLDKSELAEMSSN